jgi:soluble lytic murein transglycosylase
VEASIQGKLWDDIPLRFPMAHQSSFEHASKKHKVNIDEIRAISRRESAFFLYATSGVGARGLMQIMPATAKATAKKHGAKYSDPKDLYSAELNLNLGSAYYAQLLKDFNQNRVLATAAYNAGPSRVRRWLAESNGKLDAMSFIESIPFTETREYVQAVLSYRLIYEAQKQKPQPLFNEAELKFHY